MGPQSDRHLKVAATERIAQRRAAPAVGGVRIGLVLEEELNNAQVAFRRCEVEACPLVIICGIHVDAAREKKLERAEEAAACLLAQRGCRL